MGLDIRVPIGIMFAIIGAMLVIFGAVSDPAIYARSLGLNLNLWWGAALLVFAAVMLGLARRAGAGRKPSADASGR